MWVPRWLGEIYARLYARYGSELFTFKEAEDWLGSSGNKLRVAFNELRSRRMLLFFERRRPRRYRLTA